MKKIFIIMSISFIFLIVFGINKSYAHPPGNYYDKICEAAFCKYIKLFNNNFAGGNTWVLNATPNANSASWSLINISRVSFYESFYPENKIQFSWTTNLPSDPGVRAKIQSYEGYELRYSFNKGDDAQLIPCLAIDGNTCLDEWHLRQFPGFVASGKPASEGTRSVSFTIPKDWQGELVTFQIIEKFNFSDKNVIYALAYSKTAEVKAIAEYTQPTTYKNLSWNLKIRNKLISIYNKNMSSINLSINNFKNFLGLS